MDQSPRRCRARVDGRVWLGQPRGERVRALADRTRDALTTSMHTHTHVFLFHAGGLRRSRCTNVPPLWSSAKRDENKKQRVRDESARLKPLAERGDVDDGAVSRVVAAVVAAPRGDVVAEGLGEGGPVVRDERVELRGGEAV